MVDITSTINVKEQSPRLETKVILIETPATADDGDTLDVTLSDYGAVGITAIQGFTHSTTDSIIIEEAPTTSVTTGVLTITVGGTTDDKKRSFIVWLN